MFWICAEKQVDNNEEMFFFSVMQALLSIKAFYASRTTPAVRTLPQGVASAQTTVKVSGE